MPVLYRFSLGLTLTFVALLSLTGSGNAQPSRSPSFSWNIGSRNLPLLRLPDVVHGDLNDLLTYPAPEFTLPLLQPMAYNAECDCYSLTVVPKGGRNLRVLQLWPTTAGFYRSQNGPYLELEDFGALKAVTALDGTRYLFAEVGPGDRHCVSIHTLAGNYLLIDYTATGLISRLRDSYSRTIVPSYQQGRIVSLTQTWTNQAGTRTQTTVVRP